MLLVEEKVSEGNDVALAVSLFVLETSGVNDLVAEALLDSVGETEALIVTDVDRVRSTDGVADAVDEMLGEIDVDVVAGMETDVLPELDNVAESDDDEEAVSCTDSDLLSEGITERDDDWVDDIVGDNDVDCDDVGS